MSNKFYKPKNEYGELLVGQPVLDKAVKDLESNIKELIDSKESSRDEITSDLKKEDIRLDGKIDNLYEQLAAAVTNINSQVTNKADELTADYTEKINEVANNLSNGFDTLNNKPSFNFIKVEGSSSVENYIDGLWQNCKSVEEKEELKIQIGQTIYLLPDTEDKKNAYEEYICINLDKILTDYTQISEIIEFVRLGSFEDIVATNERRGLVRLIHNVYDNDIQEWQNLLKEETIGGKSIGTHVPVEGLAVAPCALYEFRKADDNLRAEFKKDDDAIRSELQAVNTKVQQITNELNGVIEGNEDAFQNSRLDIIEKEIDNVHLEFSKINGELGIALIDEPAPAPKESRLDRLEKIIGIDGCESTCQEDHCDGIHNCNCNAANLDCSIICKIESIEEGLTSNSGEIVDLSAAISENSEQIGENSEQIVVINENISTLEARIEDQKTIISDLEFDLNEKIKDSNAVQQTAVSGLDAKLVELKSEIGSRPEGSDYANISIWTKVQNLNDSCNNNKTKIDTLEDLVDENTTSIVNVKAVAEENRDSIIEIEAKIGSRTDAAGNNTTIHAKLNELSENLSTANKQIETINADIDALEAGIDAQKTTISYLESEIGPRPEGSDYANIKIWTKVQNLNDSCDSNSGEIEKLKALVGDNNNPSSDYPGASLCAKTRYLLEKINKVDENAALIADVKTAAEKNDASITDIEAKIGNPTDAAGDNTTIHAKLNQLSNNFATICSVRDLIAENSESITKNSAFISKNTTDIAGLDLRLTSAETSAEATLGELDDYNTRIRENKNLIDRLDKDLETITAELGTVGDCINANTNTLSEVKELAEKNGSEVTNINSLIGERPEGATSIWEKFNYIDNKIGNTDSAIAKTAELIGNVGDGAMGNSSLYGAFERLSEQVGNIDEVVAETNSKINEQLDELEGKLSDVENSVEENSSKITNINSLIGERPEGATSIWNEFESINSELEDINTAIAETTVLVGNAGDGAINKPSLYGAFEKLSKQVDNINEKLDKNITSLEESIDQKVSSAELDSKTSIINEKLDGLEKSIDQKASSEELLTLTNTVDEVKETAETAKSLIDNFTARKQSFGTVVLSATIKPDNQSTPEDESILEIPYQTICEAIKQRDGVEIMPKDLTIIFNGAMYDSMSGDPEMSYHFYPDVKYIRKRTVNDTDDSKMTLQFTGSDNISNILISLTYYSSATSAAYNIN